VERIALRLVHRWRATGVDAPLFLGRTDGAMARDVGADLDFVTPRRRWPGIAHWETLWMVATLPRAVRTIRPDVLFCAGNTYAFVAVMLKLILGRNCPPIIAKISNNLDRTDASWSTVSSTASGCVSRGWRSTISSAWRSRCAPRSCNASAFCRPRRDHPRPCLSEAQIAALRQDAPVAQPRDGIGHRFVTVARLAPQKNLALMLRGFARGAAPADTLTIFGEGPERAMLEALAVELGVADRVAFRGYVANPASLLSGYDTLLLSSHYEGVPAVILEALAANIGIISTDCSRSMAALLQQGTLGTLVPVGDEAGFAAAIRAAHPRPRTPSARCAGAPLHHRTWRGPLCPRDAHRPPPNRAGTRTAYRGPGRAAALSPAHRACRPMSAAAFPAWHETGV
jgi:glycosyltransferase involved in cell wall biosynthesis